MFSVQWNALKSDLSDLICSSVLAIVVSSGDSYSRPKLKQVELKRVEKIHSRDFKSAPQCNFSPRPWCDTPPETSMLS